MKISLCFLTLFCSAITAQAWVTNSGDSQSWLEQQRPSNKVYTEMNTYFTQKDNKTDASAYIKSFVNSVHSTMISETENSLQEKLNQAECESTTQVSFPEEITQQFNFKSKVKFEEEIVKVQSYDCLGHIDIKQVFEALMSPEFQLETIDGMKKSTVIQSNNYVCQIVSIFPLGTSNNCFTQNILSNPGQYIIHSFNEENKDNPSAMVYFRESIIVISQLKNGDASLYTLSYGRGPDLPFHSIIKKIIANQQIKLIENLQLLEK